MKRKKHYLITALGIIAFTLSFCMSSCYKENDRPEIIQEDEYLNDDHDNDHTEETTFDHLIHVLCRTCYGEGICPACLGTGKGCIECGGTGKHCSQCNSTGKYCRSCNSTGVCYDCNGTGNNCSECQGSGKCSTCKGTNKCEECNGSGMETCYICDGLGRSITTGAICYKCNGSGKIDCWWCKGSGICQRCMGEGTCRQCNGNPICTTCGGKLKCVECGGNPICNVCNGNPVCKTCNGDGHCSSCNHGDGKCPNCAGSGYTLEQPMESFLQCPDSRHPHLIDLGLSSGTKWACCNVGASKPEEYGGYYAWGVTSQVYGSSDYPYFYYDEEGEYQYVNIGNDIAGTIYDAAYVNWGGTWQMPTEDQLIELISESSHEWTNIGGVNGYLFTGLNGGKIFLPAAGSTEDHDKPGEDGSYWSSTLGDSELKWPSGLFFSVGEGVSNPHPYPGYTPRRYGLSVRAVEGHYCVL